MMQRNDFTTLQLIDFIMQRNDFVAKQSYMYMYFVL